MNGELPPIPQVPVTTLAGIVSLTELLPELPLPTPLSGVQSRSLLFHPRVAEEAERHLASQDPALVAQLAQALALTSADHIELQEQYASAQSQVDLVTASPLLQGILLCNPVAFSGKGEAIKSEEIKQEPVFKKEEVKKEISKKDIVKLESISKREEIKNEPIPGKEVGKNEAPTKGIKKQSSSSPVPIPNPPSSALPNHFNNCSVVADIIDLKEHPVKTETFPHEEEDTAGSRKMRGLSIGTSIVQKCLPANSFLGDKNDAMKKPFIKLVKLSNEDLKNLSVVPSQASSANVNVFDDNDFTGFPSKSSSGSKLKGFNKSSERKPTTSGRLLKAKFESVDLGSDSEDDGKKKPVKYFKSREKEREEKKKKDKAEKKRNRISSDEEFDPVEEKKKRRKTDRDDEDDYDEDEDDGDAEYNDDEGYESKKTGASAKRYSPKKIAYDKKRIERKIVGMGEKLSNDELMETGVYQRFTRCVEKIFDNTEDIDLSVEIEEDGDVPQEYLIPKYELSELCSESAKIKSLGAMSLVPPERLVRLLNILEKNIRNGVKVTPISEEDDEEDDKFWLEIVMERILRAVDASLTVMYILTANHMNKRVYLEDVIERCVQFAKFQLNNTIYPSFDPVYRIDNKKDGFVGNVRKKRAQAKDVRNRNILGLYNKLHELVGLIADLLSIQTLTDTTVLQLSTLGVSPFFVENVAELQLSALRLVTKVFAKYDKHRRLLLDDILASIARLPNSKRSLRTYRLNSDENIQMLTALVLQLIQCVVELPEQLVKDSKSLGDGNNVRTDKNIKDKDSGNSKDASAPKSDKVDIDRDVLVSHKYETAMGTAISFLTVFLQKTGSKSEEIDYRPLFENFIQDLLLTVNKPEWPASELLLSFLGKLLVQKFSNKGTDVTLRVSSLDCLGIVAARLRRDAVTSHLKVNRIDQIIREIKEEENVDSPILEDGLAPSENGTNSNKKNKKKKGQKDSDASSGPDSIPFDEEEERTIFLQRVLLDWLAVNSESEAALIHARHFYIGQWYRDAFTEILAQRVGPISPKKLSKKSGNKKKRKKRKGESSEEETTESEEDVENEDPINTIDDSVKNEVMRLAERRKQFLLTKVAAFPPASPGARTQTLQTHIDYESAELITRYLASKRSFSQSFDNYLKQILRVLSESAIAVRTKAMKCLTMVVEADPAVLGRADMQMGVHHSFLDHSTSVREAAVDLVGKFVLSRPELISKYYEMIAARILDTGVSVRKRVIKIMKDICLEYPEFQKIPEICVKMIRRVNDEEGIKKLVQEVFQNMWFTPVREKPQLDQGALLVKVNNITEVVIACKETGLDWFEQLLYSMFRPKEDKEDVTKVNTEPPKALVTACKQIVDCLVKHILVLEENGIKTDLANKVNNDAESEEKKEDKKDGEMEIITNNKDESKIKKNFEDKNNQAPRSLSQRLIACLTTLYLFAKIRPQLLVDHAITLQPYLALKCQTQGDYTVIGVVARTLELVVPLMEHPSETFLAQLEEDAVKLILLHDRTVITSCLALLGSIVNTVTKNYRLIKDCFNKYYSFISDYKKLHEENSEDPKLETYKPFFRRALYTVGLLLRHFDFNRPEVRCGIQDSITEHVVETLLYFIELMDINIQFCTLQSLGSVCIRHYDLMTTKKVKALYHNMLLNPEVDVKLRIQTIQNVESYLQEEEIRMIKQDQEWAKLKLKENLKEMCDIQSGMASAIIQIYLKQILECVVAANMSVRHTALKVIQLVLAQGLVHPVQIVPYLICMSSDSEEMIAHTADKQLQDIEKKYPGFINMKAMQGFRLSYRLQTLIQPQLPTRGFKQKKGENPGALNGFLYSIMRGTKQQRRAVAMSLLKQFDEQAKIPLADLLFIADNLAYFPYQVIDEPLFIMHHIDIMISVTGSNLLQMFKEALKPLPKTEVILNPETGKPVYEDEDDDETAENIYERLPEDMTPLVDCAAASQGCLLILMLKDHLKEVYGITDNKIWHYSPSDSSKQYEKNCGKKSITKFQPKRILARLMDGIKGDPCSMTEEEKKIVIEEYFSFKDLMLKIDREEEVDSDAEDESGTNRNHEMQSRTQRLQQQAKKPSDIQLLPGTHDGWEDQADVKGKNDDPNHHRSPIKPLTIRTSQLSSPSHKEKRHRRSSSHHKSSGHKKHKKKKKRKKYNSDSGEDEESEFSDPDFLA